jgi:hypothetical protein
MSYLKLLRDSKTRRQESIHRGDVQQDARYDRKLWIGDFLSSVVYLPFEQSNGKPTRQRRRREGDTGAQHTSP